MSRLPTPLPAFVINVEQETARLASTQAAFAAYRQFVLERVPGVVLPSLPGAALIRLVGRPETAMGRLGCFLGHVGAWERIAAFGTGWGLVVEDDIQLFDPERLFDLDLPADAELIWVNGRMIPPRHTSTGESLSVYPARQLAALRIAWPPKLRGQGADGYLLSSAGARKILTQVASHGFPGHVDSALWRMTIPFDAMEEALAGVTAELPRGKDPRRFPRHWWGVVSGYYLSSPVVGLNRTHSRMSVRRRLDTKPEAATPVGMHPSLAPEPRGPEAFPPSRNAP